MNIVLKDGKEVKIDKTIDVFIYLSDDMIENKEEFEMDFGYKFIPGITSKLLYFSTEDYNYLGLHDQDARWLFNHYLDSYCYDYYEDNEPLREDDNLIEDFMFIRYSDNEFILKFKGGSEILLLKFKLM
jgi:hypothetical protein